MEITGVAGVREKMELRHPPMPTEVEWQGAIKRARPMFGTTLADHRAPATVVEFAKKIRELVRQHQASAATLVDRLREHAEILGLDARSGRLATAKRVAKLLRDLAG